MIELLKRYIDMDEHLIKNKLITHAIVEGQVR